MVQLTYAKLIRFERPVLGICLFSIGTLTLIDIFEDFSEGTHLRHLALDLAIAVSAYICVLILILHVLHGRNRIQNLEKEKLLLSELSNDLKFKSKAYVEGLSILIDRDFDLWGLSQTEREVGLFLLKGLSVEEISNIRGSSGKTIRNQISAIYRKSNIKTRQEFQAYFLEDLLVPVEEPSEQSI